MSYKISDAQQRLAERLGESNAPNSGGSEAAKRRRWFQEAVETLFTEKPYWFMQSKYGAVTTASKQKYSFPSDFRSDILLHVDDYRYKKIDITDQDKDIYLNIVDYVNSKYSSQYYRYFTVGNEFYLLPIPTKTPDSVSFTYTLSGETLTVTSADHGLESGDMVLFSGFTEDELNSDYEVTKVDGDTFTVEVSSSTATGNPTYQKCNIVLWYYVDEYTYTSDDDPIGIPDRFINLLVSYAEGRYWSSAHMRGKASDAFTEFDTILTKINLEDMRKKFKTGLNGIYI